MIDDLLPVRDEAALRVDVLARSARLRRRYRAAVTVPTALVVVLAVLFSWAGGGGDDAHLRVADSDRTTLLPPDGSATPMPSASGGPAPPVSAGLPDVSVAEPTVGTTTTAARRGTPSTTAPITTDSAAVPRMAFVRGGHLYEQRTDGTALRALGDIQGSSPSWSPDGTAVAFAESWRIAVFDVVRGERRVLFDPVELRAADPAWSPDGRYVAITGTPRVESDAPGAERAVWVVDVTTGESRRVVAGKLPAWSPDSRRLLFDCDGRLCTAPLDGSSVTPVPGSESLSDAAWSPDGAWLAARHSVGHRLVVLHPDGSGRRELSDRATAGPAWFPAGGRLAYPIEGGVGIWSADLDGNGRRQLTDRDNDRAPSITST